MSFTGLEPFDSTIQKTNEWLKELCGEMGTDDRHRAYLSLRAVLHTLRDRITPEEATELGAQLPMLIRGFYYDGWNPSAKREPLRHKDEFLKHIQGFFPNEPDLDPENIARAVFSVLNHHITRGEIKDVRLSMKPEIRDLWPQAAVK